MYHIKNTKLSITLNNGFSIIYSLGMQFQSNSVCSFDTEIYYQTHLPKNFQQSFIHVTLIIEQIAATSKIVYIKVNIRAHLFK